MNRAVTIIAIVVLTISLGILISSLAGAKDIKIPQDNGTRTGLPVWHPPLEGYDSQTLSATILFSAIVMAISAYLTFRWTAESPQEFRTYFIDKNANKAPTIEFDRLLAWYSAITTCTGLLYFAIDIGKIWVTTGVLHNAIEVVILYTLHQGGGIKSSSIPAWIISYVLLTSALSFFLEWPNDALWFKMQGLIIDYVLFIQFTRIYLDTRNGYGDATYHRLFDTESTGRNISRESNRSESEAVIDGKSVGYFRPYYTLLLVFASFIHIFGNIYITIWAFEIHSYSLFAFTYCITFPLYAYFVYLDTHTVAVPPAQKYIVLPDNSKLTVTFVILLAVFLSFLTAKISLVVQNHD